MAFTQNTNPTFVKQPQNGKVQFTTTGGGVVTASTGALTNAVTIYTAGASGSKITALLASSTDSSAQTVVIAIYNGATYFVLGSTSIPITAGTISATGSVDLMNSTAMPALPLDSDGNHYLILASGDTLVATALGLTASKVINFTALGGDF